jgi:hypothetical protein
MSNRAIRSATVPVKMDPYGAYILTDFDTAMKIQEAADPRFGGGRGKSRRFQTRRNRNRGTKNRTRSTRRS